MSNASFPFEWRTDSAAERVMANLLYISTAKYGGDWNSLLHSHAHTELFYVVGGQGQFRVPGQQLAVSADDLVIVSPNVEHTELSLNASPLEYIVLGMEGLEFMPAADHENGYSMLSLRGARDDILPYLREMLREIETKQKGFELVCTDLLEVLVVKLMRHSDFMLTVAPSQHASTECAVVKRYLDTHFKESISLEFLAGLAHVNKYHLVHSFRKEYGMPPISYLVERRIRESQHLLSKTDHSLSQIAQLLGFSSPSYFSQSFRKVAGVSPQEYRRAAREQANA